MQETQLLYLLMTLSMGQSADAQPAAHEAAALNRKPQFMQTQECPPEKNDGKTRKCRLKPGTVPH